MCRLIAEHIFILENWCRWINGESELKQVLRSIVDWPEVETVRASGDGAIIVVTSEVANRESAASGRCRYDGHSIICFFEVIVIRKMQNRIPPADERGVVTARRFIGSPSFDDCLLMQPLLTP